MWVALVSASAAGAEDLGSVAFYYGDALPSDRLAHFDHVVVQPEHIDRPPDRALSGDTQAVAYVSVGEARRDDRGRRGWTLGRNEGWDRPIMDLTSIGWQRRIMARVDRLAAAGYQAFFLDTLDSYRRAVTGDDARAAQRAALVAIVRRIRSHHPDAMLLINRGFEVLPRIHDRIDGVVAESLHAGWDQSSRRYVDVDADSRDWLLERLKRVRERFGLPVVVIDYVAERERARARALAQRIAEAGFVPYVTNHRLDMIGVGSVEVVPRRLLVLYNGDETALTDSAAFNIAAPVLEYLGYALEYRDVGEALPQRSLVGRYAGVVAWLDGVVGSDRARFERWISDRVLERVPLVLVGQPVVRNSELLAAMGVERGGAAPTPPLEVVTRGPGARGFEGRPEARRLAVPAWRSASDKHDVAFAFRDTENRRWEPIAAAPWGGYALAPFVLEALVDDHNRWRIDPFRFFSEALDRSPFPIPDPTTENGRRILTTHIDGDGFSSRAEREGTPLAARVVLERVLERFRLPTTVSVIEAELAAADDPPGRGVNELEALARALYRRDYVEAASHSFSHPYDWRQPGAVDEADAATPAMSALAPADYQLDFEREIDASVDYIEQRLLPPGKRVATFLWSGNANPPPEAVRRVHALGIANFNGGDTAPTERFPSVTELSPHLRPTAGGLQYLAPVTNEIPFTDGWRGPYYGYRRAIEAMHLTGRPRRLKPFGIYYHFYSGTKPASLEALVDVHEWVLARAPLALWVSEYVARVRGFHEATLARDLDGTWSVRALHGLRTLRLPSALGRPRLASSRNIAGWRNTRVGRYIHLSGDQARLALADDGRAADEQPRLVAANGVLEQWEAAGPGRVRLRLRGHRPLRFAVAAPDACRLDGASARREADDDVQRYALAAKRLDATLVCH